ncbi:MAG TPA: methyltransferase domain-containing protein [Candidatus Thermoplasmatota archaeon]
MTRSFGWDANLYEDASTVQQKWGIALMESRAWRGDEHVLDAGCGTGLVTEELVKRVPNGHVVAVDNDPMMVEKAVPRLGRYSGRVEALAADVLALPSIGPFDVIFSNAVFHWVQDHDKLFLELFRHLKPGGELLAQCGGEGNLEKVRTVTEGIRQEAAFAPFFRGWNAPWNYQDDASTTERLFISGFVPADASLKAAPVTFPDDETFARFANAVILRPYLGALPTPQLRGELLGRFLERMDQAGHGRTLDYVRLTIRAQRPPHVS